MSAAKMVADSTQSDTGDGKKRKKKVKKSVKKVSLPEDEDADLDLKKDLKPISFYLKDRAEMIEEMFHSVRGASLQRALPELLKSLPLEELQSLCKEQLEVMSKKRIQRILAGEESANISSSGTDDIDDEEEEDNSSDEDTRNENVADKDDDDSIAQNIKMEKIAEEDEQQELVDSTCLSDDRLPQPPPKEPESEKTDAIQDEPQPPPAKDVYIKQEPLDSDYDQRGYSPDNRSDDSRRSSDDSEEEEEEDSVIEEGYEEPPEAYTSGSEDGELVRKESLPADTVIKQEVMDENDNDETGEGGPGANVNNKDGEKKDRGVDESETKTEKLPNVEQLEGDLLSSVEKGREATTRASDEAAGAGGEGGGGDAGDVVLPSIMMDQMELLELEMRARAIKAMLMTAHQEEEPAEDEPAP